MPLCSCPFCGKPNQPFAGFCLSCGEPTDADTLDLVHSISEDSRQARVPTNPAQLATHRLEFLLGLAILFAITGYAFYCNQRDSAFAAHYSAGQAAIAGQDYTRAYSEFQAAGGYRDSEQQIQLLKETISQRDRLYTQAQLAMHRSEWVAAAVDLKQVISIQNNYKDAYQLLRTARRHNGIMLNRTQDGALRISEVDGGEVRVVPGTNAQTYVLAISPDSEWLLYKITGPLGPELHLYSVVAAISHDLILPGTASPQQLSARFLPNTESFWVAAGGGIYYFNLPSPYDNRPVEPVEVDADSVNVPFDRVTMK